jgi:hypothetical protein
MDRRRRGWGDGRRERRGQTFGSIVVDRDTTRRDLRALLRVRDVAEDDIAGQAISGLECCHICSLFFLSSFHGVCKINWVVLIVVATTEDREVRKEGEKWR